MRTSLLVIMIVVGVSMAVPEWHYETVDTVGAKGCFASLQLNTEGNPCIAYGGDDMLSYAHFEGDAWFTETVDDDFAGFYCNSLVLDSQGNPHIAYVHYEAGAGLSELRYTYWDGEFWQTEAINPEGYGVTITTWSHSLAIDSQDRPHIAYWPTSGPSMLYYTFFDGTVWHSETVELGTNAGYGTSASIVLDSEDIPHIAALAKPGPYGNTINYQSIVEGVWTRTVLGSCGGNSYDQSTCISITMDKLDVPHIASASGGRSLTYYFLDGENWSSEVIADGVLMGQMSIAVDENNRPCVSARTVGTSLGLQYCYEENTMWNSEIIDDGAGCGYSNSLALDTLGLPHIAYDCYTSTDEEKNLLDYDYRLSPYFSVNSLMVA